MTEQTLVLVKPDGVKRNLIGEIIRRIETKGYVIVEMKKLTPSRELLAQHYAEHEGKPFYEPLVEFMASGDVVALKVEGNRVIEGFRALAGATDRTPAPNAVTATSAMRLKLVFVDISFLSKVVPETFSSTADKERVFVL